MQFILVARDAKDDQALERRMSVRDAHLANIKNLIDKGQALLGAALLDGEKMCGSVIAFDVPSREYLDEWLKNEPFVTHKVWDEIEITPVRLAPGFEHLTKKVS